MEPRGASGAVPLQTLGRAPSTSAIISSLRPFLNGLAEPVLLIDPAGSVLHANHAFGLTWRCPAEVPGLPLLGDLAGLSVHLTTHAGVEAIASAQLNVLRESHGQAVAGLVRLVDRRDLWAAELLRLVTLLHRAAAEPEGLVPTQRAPEHLPELSVRERDVLREVLRGKRVVTIAADLCLSEHTVRNYLKRIYRKLDVHSLGELRERLAPSAGDLDLKP